MSLPHSITQMTVPRPVVQKRHGGNLADGSGKKTILLGRVKWFGGFNNSTGRENHYGFIEADGVDFYVHRKGVICAQELMTEGAQVVFHRLEDRSGKPAATCVRVLSGMASHELFALLKESRNPQPEFVLTTALIIKDLDLIRDDVLQAVAALRASKPGSELLRRFWNELPPASPNDAFYALAPEAVKSQVCQQHYSALRQALRNLLNLDNGPPTSITAHEVYRDLDESDRRIAAMWAGSEEAPILAQMLSARGAEKAAARLYRQAGAVVEDVAITQLDRTSNDWLTHDLNVDQTFPVDVKNARMPINSGRFYVEHTVPRFKLDRVGAEVRIAGVLSPYLQKRFIDNPESASFKINDIVLLGETSRRDIDNLIEKYRSPHFEVVRGNERTFPNWVFGYSERWYPGLRDLQQSVVDLSRDIPEDDWPYLFNADEVLKFVAALCAMGMPPPSALTDHLSDLEADFCTKLTQNLERTPSVPDIFLTLLSDFVEAVVDGREKYSPELYNDVIFSNKERSFGWTNENPVSKLRGRMPLGAIDPLGLIAGIVKALTTVWENRQQTALGEFSNFRFGGLGLLQARRSNDAKWTTILAYCGGTEYETDEGGEIVLSDAGRPKPKGRCGNTPLVIGGHDTCSNCGKLLCDRCGFCSVECREQAFQARAGGRDNAAQIQKRKLADGIGPRTGAPPWPTVPMGNYEDYFWKDR